MWRANRKCSRHKHRLLFHTADIERFWSRMFHSMLFYNVSKTIPNNARRVMTRLWKAHANAIRRMSSLISIKIRVHSMFSIQVCCSSGASYFEVVYSIWFPINNNVFKNFYTTHSNTSTILFIVSCRRRCCFCCSSALIVSLDRPYKWIILAHWSKKGVINKFLRNAKEIK